MKIQKYFTLGFIVLFTLLFTEQSHGETVPEPTAESAASTTQEPKTPSKENKKKKKEKVEVSGILQTHFLQRLDANNDGKVRASRFRVQRARISFKGKVNRHVSYDVMIDPRSPDISGVLRDAFFDVREVIPRHRLRIGQQKTQFGYENGRSSSRLYTVNRAEVSDNVARGDATVRYDTFDDDGDIFRRWTLGLYYGRPRDEFRVLVNYERQEDEVELDDGSIEVTRGDDRFYVWTQVRF